MAYHLFLRLDPHEPLKLFGLGEDITMKLGEIASHVINFLREHPQQEYTANTLLMHLGLPLKEKRRLYDVIEVLCCAGLVDIRREARKRYFHWKPSNIATSVETPEIDLPPDPLFLESGTVLHLLLHMGPTAFQELSNGSAVKMLERDIKRTVWGTNAVSVIRVALQNQQGRVLKETSVGTVPSAAY
ncbi:MAG: hypothetical protein ACFFAL_08500 [Promethearchaeota archaeon]